LHDLSIYQGAQLDTTMNNAVIRKSA